MVKLVQARIEKTLQNVASQTAMQHVRTALWDVSDASEVTDLHRVFHGPEFKIFIIALCGYELTACVTSKVPTVTFLNKKSKHIVGTTILGLLAAHFYSSK